MAVHCCSDNPDPDGTPRSVDPDWERLSLPSGKQPWQWKIQHFVNFAGCCSLMFSLQCFFLEDFPRFPPSRGTFPVASSGPVQRFFLTDPRRLHRRLPSLGFHRAGLQRADLQTGQGGPAGLVVHSHGEPWNTPTYPNKWLVNVRENPMKILRSFIDS